MSKLQKCILEEGLIAHWDGPFDLALNRREPGSFDIRNILVDFFHADKKDVTMSYWSERRGDHRQRLAKPRAAISRSISRLMKRGFLERVEPAGRGRWRLTKEGIEGASEVCTALKKPTKSEMIKRIKKALLSRSAGLIKLSVRSVLAPQGSSLAAYFRKGRTR